jgi:UDP-N-acetyl-D-glucosamine dehydrogenase
VTYHDPYVLEIPRTRRYPHLHLRSSELSAAYLQQQDCVLIVTDHSAYDWDFIVRHSQLVVDTRNATRHVTSHRDRIVKA